MRLLPSGTVTFLFTDIEGSTRLLRDLGDRYAELLERQRALVRSAFQAHSGIEVDTQGDAFFVAFQSAPDAVAAAYDAQLALAATPIRVRMGLHTGTPMVTAEGYVGLDVHKGARICAVGHGGQVLLSRNTRALLGPDVEVRDLGEHRLKDLAKPEWLFQLVAPRLRTDFPPLKTLNNTNLPADVTPMIGREREADELASALNSDDVRLITLTGPGGSGKTRLAIHVGSQLIERYRNGVFLIEFAGLHDPALVLPSIAHTLGAVDTRGEVPLESLRGYLQDRSILLILDNMETLLDAATDIAKLLGLTSELKILVTSRERLHVHGEHEYVLSPLSLNDSVALFSQRASVANPALAIAAATDTVTAICERLDRLPLAIELAAAQVKHLDLDVLLTRLHDRLGALTGGPRDAPARQRTLRATFDWSYDLLTPTERATLTGAAVFAGGFALAAAEAVCAAEERTILALVDKSLLHREKGRYRMLETVREYALERFAALDEERDTRRRHAGYFLALAEAAQPELTRSDQVAWFKTLEDEHDNFRAMLRWFLQTDEDHEATRACAALWLSWLVHGRLIEGRRWLEEVRSRATVGIPRAWALFGMANIAIAQGDRRAAIELMNDALQIARACGDERVVGRCLWGIGVAMDGPYETSVPYFEEALSLLRGLGDDEGAARSLLSLGQIAWIAGDMAAAHDHFAAALDLQRRTGDLRGTAASLSGLGDVARAKNDLMTARSCYEEALQIRRQVGERGPTAGALFLLGIVARTEGDYRTARALQEEALAIAREIGAMPRIGDSLRQLARLATDESDYAKARALLEEALEISHATSSPTGIALVLDALAYVARRDGKPEEAIRLERESLQVWRSVGGTAMTMDCVDGLSCALADIGEAARAAGLIGAADALREKLGCPRTATDQEMIDRALAALRERVGADTVAAWRSTGRAMSYGEMLDSALEPTVERPV